jgi:hypothetical protein
MNFFKKLFKSETKNQTSEPLDISKYNSFTIFFDEENEPNIKINIAKTSEKDAESFAMGMFLLSKGAYVISTLDLLHEMSKNDEIIGDFRKHTMIHWYAALTTYEKQEKSAKDDPVVSPTKFTSTIEKT